jgi:hypothetical protein
MKCNILRSSPFTVRRSILSDNDVVAVWGKADIETLAPERSLAARESVLRLHEARVAG